MAAPLLTVILYAACGGGGSSKTDTPGLSGNWQMSLKRADSNVVKTASGFLLQAGDSLTGNLLVSAGAGDCAGVGLASGQVNASNVTLTVGQAGRTVNFSGTVGTGSPMSMSGSYSILASPCGATQTGTWTASEVQPLNGKLSGSFTSKSGQQFQLGGMIAEGANTGSSIANLSGNLTTTDTCFSSASLSGVISGTAMVLNPTSNEGVPLGLIQGTVSVDGTSITATYSFSNPNTPPLGGCEDSGTATIDVQN
jgi:hypothetical protein